MSAERPDLMPLIVGYWKSMAVYAAASLGIADLLAAGPRSPAELAEATGTQAATLRRLLRALASDGVFAELPKGRFCLTPLASRLLNDAPDSQRAAAITNGEEHYRVWGEILFSLRTGKTAFEHVYGKPVFDWLAENPRAAALFDQTMTGVHGAETAAMLDAYDFSGLGTVADIGGGNGSMLIAILQRHPRLRGILFDRPHVVERARSRIAAAGLAERCQAEAGDFFQSVPSGADAYVLRHIIHDWNDNQSLTILSNCRQAMRPSAKLLLVEAVIPEGNAPCWAKYLDLTMLLIPGGQERTEPEYRDLLGRAGFRLDRIVPTTTEIAVLEASPRD